MTNTPAPGFGSIKSGYNAAGEKVVNAALGDAAGGESTDQDTQFVTKKCNKTVVAHGDGDIQIVATAAYLVGVYCNTAMTGNFQLRDGTADTADAAHKIDGLSANAKIDFDGAEYLNGIFLDDAWTAGEVVVHWIPTEDV